MTFQHRHFEVIAATLRQSRPTIEPGNTLAVRQWHSTVTAFINTLDGCNARFDRERFLQACGAAGLVSDLAGCRDPEAIKRRAIEARDATRERHLTATVGPAEPAFRPLGSPDVQRG